MEFIAKTLFGLEQVLADDLKALGASEVKVLNRAVAFVGDMSLMYRANMHLRTAIKILHPIVQFEAVTEQLLYDQVRAIDWSKWLATDQTFAIDSTVHSDHFTHSKYIALKMKDGMMDQLRDKFGKRPSVDVDNPDIRFNIHIYKSEVSISLDSSGDLLNRRGYRNVGHLAPLNEVLAAGMLKLAGWQPEIALHDPMCGTGTILLEAAMMATNTAPGLYRKSYGFWGWPQHDPILWNDIRKKAMEAFNPAIKANIYGGDIDVRAVRAAHDSIKFLKLDKVVKVGRLSFENQRPQAFSGTIVTNPPYGERMLKADINAFYKMIGDQLKQHFSGYSAWLLSSNVEAIKQVGLRPSQKLTLFNGPLECKFFRYDLYQGSKKGGIG